MESTRTLSTVRSRLILLVVSLGLLRQGVLAAASMADPPVPHYGGTASNNEAHSSSTDNDDPWETVGGAAVNEKERTGGSIAMDESVGFDPATHPAHLGHALEGLQRYPNYLQRWNDDADVQRLEEALTVQLDKVRRQRHTTQERRLATQQLVRDFMVTPQGRPFADLLEAPASWNQLRQRVLDMRLVHALEGSWRIQQQVSPSAVATPPPLPWQNGTSPLQLEASQLQVLMEQEVPDVYSLPLFQPSFCRRLVAYLTALAAYREQQQQSSEKDTRRWLDLDHVGLSWLNDWLLVWIVEPLARHLFVVDCVGSSSSGTPSTASPATTSCRLLDWRQGYLAAYTHSPDVVRPRQGLVAHTDDSEVTLNMCLNEAFTGGDLAFFGLRGSPEEGRLKDEYQPQMGRALLHPGRYLHGVTDVTSGDRYALILWTRSWSGIRAAACPCCWLTRRQVSSSSGGGRAATCICGRAWN
jgi:hypothetical protein